MEKKIVRRRLEEDGLFISASEHWELLENRCVYIWCDKKYHNTIQAYVNIPRDIIRHLNLKNKDKIMIAIRKEEK